MVPSKKMATVQQLIYTIYKARSPAVTAARSTPVTNLCCWRPRCLLLFRLTMRRGASASRGYNKIVFLCSDAVTWRAVSQSRGEIA
ncbi:hypothetical protein FKM82_011768 [Ascaphus truei]